ncbi:MAG: lipopolysaccharide heptosyltransferase II, partial [Deltaproteobacteria bacterium]|nr:lipopolysaccharide heptosyltransferase II [Deltaproteobacteria bacterium]
VPVVTIFGPTSPSFGYAPYGKNVQIVEKALSCRPCHHHGPMVCPKEHFRCMRDITVNDVMDAIERTGALT